ncbi:UTP--glucose-1-phosphate uridylyltransferase GalU [Geobacillus thermoleovorans]|uniref:UTP--glucose-1-phosphate uridylyltransferase GalU n=1 Tax=Geobacillus thermoleovorans TaxID=33941 RepID=UPI003DA62FF2
MKKVRKAVIPAAGLGTRFLPATKAMPKEMLPIVDKPTIQYIVEEAVNSGIEDIIIVTGRSKRAIEDHFDKNYELESNLQEKNKIDLLKIVQDITNMVDIYYVRQKEALGLGHAIWCARKFIGDEPFAVLLGDMVIDSEVPCLKQMIDIYEEKQCSVIAVEPVEWSEVHKYGIVDGQNLGRKLMLVKNLIEKPKHNPPSNLAIIGRYILDPMIFEILENTNLGVNGEIQLTDALQELALQKKVYSYQFDGKLYDVGSKLGFLQATIEFALKDGTLKNEFYNYLVKFLEECEVKMK